MRAASAARIGRRGGLGLLALLGSTACLEPAEGFTLSMCFVQEGDEAQRCPEAGAEAVFYADNSTVAGLRIEVPEGTTPGKQLEVRTSLGALRPSAGDTEGRASRTVTTQGESPLFVDLFVGSDPGQGVVTVENADTSAGGLSATASFEVRPLTNRLTITPPTGPVVADGRTLHELTVALDTETDAPQTVTLRSTRGKLDPAGEGADAFQRTLSIERDTPLTLQLLAPPPGSAQGNDAAQGQLRARIGDGLEAEASFEIVRATEELELTVAPGTYYADGQSTIPVEVAFTSEVQDLRTISLRTSRGIFSGSSDGQSTVVNLRGGESTEVLLLAQRQFGLAVLTAAVDDDGAASASVPLVYSPPTLMTLVATEPLLTVSNQFIALNAYFGRPLGEGEVSEGTRVYLASCCDDDGNGTPSACDALVELPAFVDASADAPGQVTATAYLSTQGKLFVETVVAPPPNDLLVEIYAYVVDAGSGPAPDDCAALADPAGLPVTALDSTTIALRQDVQP